MSTELTYTAYCAAFMFLLGIFFLALGASAGIVLHDTMSTKQKAGYLLLAVAVASLSFSIAHIPATRMDAIDESKATHP